MEDEGSDKGQRKHAQPVRAEIPSMPGCFRHNINSMIAEIKDARRYEIIDNYK